MPRVHLAHAGSARAAAHGSQGLAAVQNRCSLQYKVRGSAFVSAEGGACMGCDITAGLGSHALTADTLSALSPACTISIASCPSRP